ncbi:MAG: hypothetical protein ACOCVG_00640 [Verrucomicrobiota bacterium]
MSAALAASVLGLSAQDAGFRFASYLPEEVVVSLHLRSISDLQAKLEAHPLSELWASEQSKAFFSNFFEGEAFQEGLEEVKAELGIDPFELMKDFKGEVVLAFGKLPEHLESGEIPTLYLLADFAGDAETLKSLMQRGLDEMDSTESMSLNFDDDFTETEEGDLLEYEREIIEESYEGETLYFVEERSEGDSERVFGWALAQGVLVLTPGEHPLREVIEGIVDGEVADPLAEAELFRAALSELPEQDTALFINFERLLPAVRSLAEQAMAENPQAAQFFNFEAFWEGLGIDALRMAYYGTKVNAETLEGSAVAFYDRLGGLLGAAIPAEPALPPTQWVPESALSVSVSAMDLGAFLRELEQFVMRVSPMAGSLYQGQLARLKQEEGLDIRAAVLENLSPGLVSTAAAAPDTDFTDPESAAETSQIIAFRLRDPAAFADFLKRLRDMASQGMELFEENPYLDYTIISMKNMPDQAFSYALAEDHFLLNIGQPQALRDALSGFAEPGTPYFERRTPEQAFEGYPAGLMEMTYADLPKLAAQFFAGMAIGFAEGSGDDMPERLPDFSKLGYGYSAGSWTTRDGARSRFLIAPRAD